MELPKKIEIIEENYTAYIPEIVNIAETVNNLISYLESQKEGEEPKQTTVKEIVAEMLTGKQEQKPKQIDVSDVTTKQPEVYTDNFKTRQPKEKCICKHTSGHHTKCPAWVDEGVMKKYVPQPKEIDVEGLLHEYANLVIKNQDMPVTDR